MSRRGLSSGVSNSAFANFHSFRSALPSKVEVSNTNDENIKPQSTNLYDSQQGSAQYQNSSPCGDNDDGEKNDFNCTSAKDDYPDTSTSDAFGRVNEGSFNYSCNESSSQVNSDNPDRSGKEVFGLHNNEESSRHVNFGGSGRGGSVTFGSNYNEKSSESVNFASSGRGRRGISGGYDNADSSGHVNFGNSGRGGRGAFGSNYNEDSSGNVNFGSSGRGGRGAFGSNYNEDSSGNVNFGASGRGGRGAFRSHDNGDSSGHVNFGNSGRGGRGAFGSNYNEDSSGHVNFGSSGRGGRGAFGSNYNEDSSGHVNFGSSGRGGRGTFGSNYNEDLSGHVNFGNSGRGGRGAFRSHDNGDSSGHVNLGSSGRGRRGISEAYDNGHSSGHVNFGSSGRGGRGGSNYFSTKSNNYGGGDINEFLGNAHSGQKLLAATHVPIDRSIEILLDEDKRNNIFYSQVADQDDDVDVSGASYRFKFESWAECEFVPELMENIKLTGYVKPRNIQAFTMPQIMNGFDVKGQAETGSGKTAAFLLPIINDIIANNYERKPQSPIAIIISPTRELALQTHEQARKFAHKTGVTAAKCYGQYKVSENIVEIRNGCDILSATPGRLKSFVLNGDISLQCLRFFILDEADELFTYDFVQTIRECLSIGNAPPKDKRINMLFSATFPSGVDELASELLNENYVTIVNSSQNGANKKVSHEILCVDKRQKNIKVCDMLLKEKKDVEQTGQLLRRTLIFVSRKQQADMLAMFFCERGIDALSLNGDRPQKLREEALNDFRAHKISVLVTTDVCARGIDIKDLDHVINVDLPKEFVTFVHRVGRTGRLREGFATSFYDPSDDYNLKEDLVNLLRLNAKDVPEFLL
ncbi:Helicase, C-terminal domain and DNA/RNA helicase, DEAD/DEAH box type, N-terminal domain and Helicase, superfamily 1/2, ATP-binding domain and RNA helicase, DEAD-box type, Q motif domain and P-loop containing nucleoside triphosphate hydrolase domain-containing protein [Strongyloides ratti]|uniref:RNA helicase n=1 Tax=Strongyloides ratti TaxID=34506 RepID=A0A090LJ07_STRRB|nr:Helicase, C-terminal domain and DNA/RNA helicase, DEAD/DEAH box type, N-terminal domain and Helicase, superfamily 1/2, ATP-binding domain and RNA helicase, DEAD-box type, Q motif domain and P-loop containing nucleoside triphosphate hydrolase domain-containing protein [Strongyloides ratti]CEF67505.1 Helicase, C-terminal domain and DNA/RNA helicase, DEAD/DEAH box type, N-terminal domain and Helicase, superfamily 1/2, ATP-binding domain and RNA helicase, DEAD-box type, Q motif domain and P-loop co